jgi:hypothetical protein
MIDQSQMLPACTSTKKNVSFPEPLTGWSHQGERSAAPPFFPLRNSFTWRDGKISGSPTLTTLNCCIRCLRHWQASEVSSTSHMENRHYCNSHFFYVVILWQYSSREHTLPKIPKKSGVKTIGPLLQWFDLLGTSTGNIMICWEHLQVTSSVFLYDSTYWTNSGTSTLSHDTYIIHAIFVYIKKICIYI